MNCAADQAALRFAATQDAALCTIVGIDGSYSRRVGAQLAIAADGTTVGSLADGCLEGELASQARLTRVRAEPALLHYGRGSPIIDFRLPCGSGLDILVDPEPDRAALTSAVLALDARRPAEISLRVSRRDLLLQRIFLPAPRLLVFGAGPEAQSLAHLAAALGTQCDVIGPDKGLSLGRPPEGLATDPWTAIVLLFHDHEWERALLGWALEVPAYYVGAIGGAAARENRRAWLKAQGHSDRAIGRLRSPIGLIRKARDAGTIALSVLAEVTQDYEVLCKLAQSGAGDSETAPDLRFGIIPSE